MTLSETTLSAEHALEDSDENLQVDACIIDIDATITDDGPERQIGPGHILNNAIFDVIARLMGEQGWNATEAEAALTNYAAANMFWDYPDFIKEFRLPEEESWARIVRWHDKHIIVHPDAIKMVKRLHAAGMPMFIVSNNPLSGCYLKLHRAKLAGLRHSDYFADVFGSNVCMGQKHMASYWQNCLDRMKVAPERLAIIGDNPRDDCALPRSLGVETVFLVDRGRADRVEKTPEAFWVNTLECVPGVLGRSPEKQRR